MLIWIRIRIQLITLMRNLDPAYQFDADPDPIIQFEADLCVSGSTTLVPNQPLFCASH
jgi:hypothetical protein